MNKHEFRLTWLFLLYGVVAIAGYSFGLPHILELFAETNAVLYSTDGLTNYQTTLVITAVAHAFVVFCLGVYSYIRKSAFHKFGLVTAVTLLIYIPVGTAIGIYYLWARSESARLSIQTT